MFVMVDSRKKVLLMNNMFKTLKNLFSKKPQYNFVREPLIVSEDDIGGLCNAYSQADINATELVYKNMKQKQLDEIHLNTLYDMVSNMDSEEQAYVAKALVTNILTNEICNRLHQYELKQLGLQNLLKEG